MASPPPATIATGPAALASFRCATYVPTAPRQSDAHFTPGGAEQLQEARLNRFSLTGSGPGVENDGDGLHIPGDRGPLRPAVKNRLHHSSDSVPALTSRALGFTSFAAISESLRSAAISSLRVSSNSFTIFSWPSSRAIAFADP